MADNNYVLLETRGVLAVSGTDATSFLQNLISNDVNRVDADHTIYAMLLTPQGKFLHDFFVAMHPENDNAFVIEAEAERIDDLEKRLSMYRLRADVSLERVGEEWSVVAAFGSNAAQALGLDASEGASGRVAGGVAFVDPRLQTLGLRLIGPREAITRHLDEAGFKRTEPAEYEHLRLSLGVPAGGRDILIEKSFPLECNLDELNAIDYEKGCYVGQELTARTHYRANLRKRLVPIRLQGPLPEPGAAVTLDGKNVGEMRSADGERGLALLRIDSLASAEEEGKPLMTGTTEIVPDLPEWLSLDLTSETEPV